MVNLTEDPRIRKASFRGFVLSEPIRKSPNPAKAVEDLSDHELVDLAMHYSVEQMCEAGSSNIDEAMESYTFASVMILSDSAFDAKINGKRETFQRYCINRAKYQSKLSECDLAVYRLRATGADGRALEDIVRKQDPEMHAQMNEAMILAARLAMDSD